MNRILKYYLDQLIQFGDFTVIDADGNAHNWGDGTGTPVTVHFRTKAAERAVALNPSLKFGEVYMNGDANVVEGSIYDVLALVFQNAGNYATSRAWMRAIERVRYAARYIIQNNTLKRARSNVQRHYDLSGALYDLFLDEDRQYSCAYFERPDVTLEEAQLAKKRHIAAKLRFDREKLKTLDIGCGWGGMGLYLAGHLDADVIGVTLSDEQLTIAKQRAADAGLADKAEFRLQDYRDTKERFDRIVSVGMFEHVGIGYYDQFFSHCAKALKNDGVMLLHTIGRYDPPGNTNAFIQKYIFPGGYIPALSEVMAAAQRSGLIVNDVEILRIHYAETIKHWRERFRAHREEAKALYDERFCRMWEFYLAASESAFRWQDLVVFQLQFTKSLDTLPITRGYMQAEEDRLRRVEKTGASGMTSRIADIRDCEAAE
ncbi:cyclopropane-fatty-acyl-phospholipid synthase family protein [Jiella sp. MQZ9-1]|uniref:Class I SAM-dependent methyltransferase n=1 Tax=Jiella flava TaxID=2816857 RepID=A0A939G0P3_9HYPH|nr:cyclopropane-fatty-acyl-phospholipid synthase family protein [Jiella flava]MBO0664344.1 class I SAM-dependent methyltransferase [Jiella flava]MCD2472980.1 cyclopropane-fatty-acyl-phospholipid synthase family protein [Jiella flava]